MKRFSLLIVIILSSLMPVAGQGLPFMSNYLSEDYEAHTRNFDILVDTLHDVVFVANFEGLIYFDNASWFILHTSGISRLTKLYEDSNGKIWVGGYNYFGYLGPAPNDDMQLFQLTEGETFRGEVSRIWEEDGQLSFITVDGQVYEIVEETIRRRGQDTSLLIQENSIVTQRLELADNFWAVATTGEGILFTDNNGQLIFSVNEDNGLCNNNVNSISYDGNGLLWGATDNGIFSLAVPSAYSRYTTSEGLRGEVLSIHLLGEDMYVGTLAGLYRRVGTHFEQVPEIRHACWQLDIHDGSLIAATAAGVFSISPTLQVKQLTTAGTTAIKAFPNGFYSGELDGVYFNTKNSRIKVSTLERVTSIIADNSENLWLQNLYGQISVRHSGETQFNLMGDGEDVNTLVSFQGQVLSIGANQEEPFTYPQFSYTDEDGMVWLTDNEGKHLYAYQDGQRLKNLDEKLYPLGNYTVRALLKHNGLLWIGTPIGLIALDMTRPDPLLSANIDLDICSVSLNTDSVLWGGFENVPAKLSKLSPNDNHLSFYYALGSESRVGSTLYRYSLNNKSWSGWNESHVAEFYNLSYGNYTFSVLAMDAKGKLSNIRSINFTIQTPFYLRWYMVIVYALLLMALGSIVAYLRTKQLEKEKIRLEGIIQERTAEIVQQRDEIVMQRDEIKEKSASLEKAMHELEQTQKELIRQEKMATAGKLTQGLIDRILNPMNYINNFSKLSIGLLNDLKTNIEDEVDHMNKENYEDTIDVLDMLTKNLEKVEQHGLNTSRILKAMEEILRDRSGGIVKMDLVELLKLNEEMVNNYFKKELSEYKIHFLVNCPYSSLTMQGNSEQLSKTFMSLLGNSIYALSKKAQRTNFEPSLKLSVNQKDNCAEVHVYDNGVGIEEAILKKIFDPFFTTKTTSEASGVGLYLSQEIIQNHGGSITVKSEKDKFTEFTITLPLLNNS